MLALVSPVFGFVPFVAHNVYTYRTTSGALGTRVVRIPLRTKARVLGELLFRVTTGPVTGHCYVQRLRPNARLMRPYVHALNVADFKGIRAG